MNSSPAQQPQQTEPTSLAVLLVLALGTTAALIALLGSAEPSRDVADSWLPVLLGMILLPWLFLRLTPGPRSHVIFGTLAALAALVAVTLAALGVRHLPASHWPRFLATLAPPALGLYLAVVPRVGRSLALRLVYASAGACVGIASWWLVPTTEGPNLLTATRSVTREQARLDPLESGDVEGFVAGGEERRILSGNYPHLVSLLKEREADWLEQTTAALGRSFLQAARTDPTRAADDLVRSLSHLRGEVEPVVMDPDSFTRPVARLVASLIRIRIHTARPGFSGEQQATGAAYRRVQTQLRDDLAALEPSSTGTAIEALNAAYAEVRHSEQETSRADILKRLAINPAAALTDLKRLAGAVEADRALTGSPLNLLGLRDRVRSALTEARRTWFTSRIALAAEAFSGERSGAVERYRSLLAEIAKDPEGVAEPELATEAKDEALQALARGRARAQDAQRAAIQKQGKLTPTERVVALRKLLNQLGEEPDVILEVKVFAEARARLEGALTAARNRALSARLDETRTRAKPLLRADRFEAAATLARDTAKEVEKEAAELARTADVARFRDAYEYAAELARAAGKKDP